MLLKRLARLGLVTVLAAGLSVGLSVGPAQAATPATITLSPTVKTVARNNNLALTVTINTGGQSVNAVEFYLTFPDARLDCSSITPTTTWAIVPEKSCNTNTAGIVVATAGGAPAVNGTVTVATVNLKATSVKGKAVVSFDRTRTFVVASTTSTDILGSTNKSTITVK